MSENLTKKTRDINVGRITGKSSYELAKEAGTFTGTEDEYNQREARLYELFNNYEKAKTELYDELTRLGKSPKGSWFEINKINNLNRCNVPVNTYINLDYIDIESLPTGMVINNDKVLFESTVTYMKNGTECILCQSLTQSSDTGLVVYRRIQLANGSFDESNWKPWVSVALNYD